MVDNLAKGLLSNITKVFVETLGSELRIGSNFEMVHCSNHS